MNFGQKMAKYKVDEKNDMLNRLNGAEKRKDVRLHFSIENFRFGDEMRGFVKGIESSGRRAEIRIVDGKMTLQSSRYERV